MTAQSIRWSVAELVPNVEHVLVGRERKPRPFIAQIHECGSVSAAMDLLAELPAHRTQLRANGVPVSPLEPEAFAEYEAEALRRRLA